MADTVINLSQVVSAVQQDNNVLTDITNICKAINKVSINGLDVATVTSNVNIIKGLGNSIKPILQTLNGLQSEMGKVNIADITGLSNPLSEVKNATNSVLGLVGEFDSSNTGDLANKVSSLAETGVQLASFAAAIYCPALKSGQVAKGLLAGLNSLGDGLKSNNGMSLDNVMNKQGLNPLLMGSVKAANSVLTELVDLDLEEWGNEAMKTMVGDKVSLITEAGSLVKNYSTSLYKNEKSGLLIDLKSLNGVMDKTSELQNLKSGSFNAIYEPLNVVLESLIFDGDELLRQATGDDMKNVMNGLLGYTKSDEEGNETKSEGLFPQLLVYSKAIEKLFQPGGTFSTLTNIDTSSIDAKKIAPTLHTVSGYLDTVIESTKEMGVNGEDPSKNPKIAQMSQASTHLESFKGVIENVSKSVSGLTDMLDSKNNPLMGGAIKMAFVKRAVKKTFRNLTSIIEIINEEIEDLSEELESLDLNKMKDDFEKISSVIKSITETVDNLIKLPLKLLLLTISTPLLILGMAMFSISLITIATITNKISQKISGLMDTTETFKKANELIKLITETVDLLISLSGKLILALPIVLLGVISGIIVAGLMFVLVAEIKLMFKALTGLDSSNVATAKQAMIDIKELLDAVLHLSLKMILLSLIMIPAIIAGGIVVAGLWVMSFIIKGIALLSNTIQSMGAKQATEAIMDIKELLKAVIDISKTFILLALIMVPALIAGVIILPGLAVFALILNAIAFTFTKLLPGAILNNAVETIKNIQVLLKTVIKISWTFILLALIMVPALIAGAIILPGLAFFALILNAIVVMFATILPGVLLKSVNKTIRNIKKLLNNIIKLSASIILLALIIVPTIIAGGIVLLGLSVFSLILTGIALILNNPANIIALKLAKNSIKEFNKVLRALMALCLTMILLALVIIPAVAASIIVLVGLGIISVVSIGITFFINMLVGITRSILLTDILHIIIVFGAIAIVMLLFLATAAIMVKLQSIAAQIDAKAIALFLAGMVVLAIAFAGLGAACVAASSVLVPAMVGILALVGAMTAITLAMLGLANLLEKVQALNIDPKSAAAKSKDVLFTSKDICLTIRDIKKELEEAGLTKKGLRQAKKTLKQMKRLIRQIAKIAKILNRINKITLDREIILSNVSILFDTATQVMATASNRDGKGLDLINMKKDVKALKRTLSHMDDVFDSLNKITDTLNKIQDIKLETEPILNNLNTIFITANDVLTNAAGEGAGLKSTREAKRQARQLKKTVNQFAEVFEGLSVIVDTLKKTQEIKLDGEAISKNISAMFASADDIINRVANSSSESTRKTKERRKDVQFMLEQYEYVFKDLSGVINLISEVDYNKVLELQKPLNEAVDKLADLPNVFGKITNKMPELAIIAAQMPLYNTFINTILERISSPFSVHEANKFDKVARGYANSITHVINATDKFNQVIKEVDEPTWNKTLEGYGQFLKRVDETNLGKLETSAKLFKQMARFSESINGNFEKLADTLNEKIAPLLEELHKGINDVGESAKTTAENTSGDMQREKAAIRNDMQERGQTRNLTMAEVDRRIDNKYRENVQQRYGVDEILSKLSTLIKLFQSGEAKIQK